MMRCSTICTGAACKRSLAASPQKYFILGLSTYLIFSPLGCLHISCSHLLGLFWYLGNTLRAFAEVLGFGLSALMERLDRGGSARVHQGWAGDGFILPQTLHLLFVIFCWNSVFVNRYNVFDAWKGIFGTWEVLGMWNCKIMVFVSLIFKYPVQSSPFRVPCSCSTAVEICMPA